METSNFTDPSDLNISRKEIFFDDIPVDSILFRDVRRTGPTPADIVLLWKKGFQLDDVREKILISILQNDIMIASDIRMEEEAESLLNQALEKSYNDPETSIRLLIALTNLHYKRDDEKSIDYYTRARLLRSESGIKLDNRTENLWKTIRIRMEKT